MIPTIAPHPWSIQLEMTEGCNRRCSFCGIHSLYREREDEKYKFMTPELAEQLAKNLSKWFYGKKGKRLEFALQGEPLLNRKAGEIIMAFRTYYNNAQLMITSNLDPLRLGVGFSASKIFDLFKCGLNILVCDYYGEKFDMTYEQFFDEIKIVGDIIGVPVQDFYDDHPKVWSFDSPNKQRIVVIDNTATRDAHRIQNNQAGNTKPELIQINLLNKMQLPRMTRCQQPFREMSIKHDGAIPLCCMDWSREHIIGKFPEDGTLEQIWSSLHFRSVRNLLFNKRRDLLSPCNRCDYRGHRVGLIKPPDMEDYNILNSADFVKQNQEINIKKYGNKYANIPFVYPNP